ncbi:unnamed protein product [Umbelopsis ramanniana]
MPAYRKLEASEQTIGYQLARTLTVTSLAAAVLLSFGALFYTTTYHHTSSAVAHYSAFKCNLPPKLTFPVSEDGTYTPTDPHPSLRQILTFVKPEDHDHYCEQWKQLADKENATAAYDRNMQDQCGNWQEKYKRLHQRRTRQLEQMKNGDLDERNYEDRPKFISYICASLGGYHHSGCGGLADRMMGMVSTFFTALITDRAYYAYWEPHNPFELETAFEAPNINWTYDVDTFNRIYDNTSVMTSRRFLDTINVKLGYLDNMLFGGGADTNFTELWPESLIESISNRGYVLHTLRNSSIYPQYLNSMGLNEENIFGCITDFLFRPTIGSRRFIDAYRYLLRLDSVLSIGVQIRTGDNNIIDPATGAVGVDMETYDYFFKCARQISESRRQPHHTKVVYFLVTDSATLRDQAIKLNDNPVLNEKYFGDKTSRVLVTGLPIEHIERGEVTHSYTKHLNLTDEERNSIEHQLSHNEQIAGVNSAIIENYILSSTSYRVITKMGYGKMAAFNSRVNGSTYALPVLRKYEAGDYVPDCSDPNAIESFENLSLMWSLG